MKNLAEKNIMVHLKINWWTAKKLDKIISAQIEKEHNAHNAGRYNKTLIDEQAMNEVSRSAKSAREFVNKRTLPWSDAGDRILPAKEILEFTNEFRQYKEDFERACNSFVKEYPTFKNEAKIRLNGMFREEDYPSLQEVQNKFNIEIAFIQIPEINDFRLDVDEEEAADLRKKIEAETKNRIGFAIRDIWSRMAEVVKRMAERLSDQDAVFRDSLVNNIQELIETLPKLNFTNNREISNTLQSMKSLLVEPETLRSDKLARSETAAQAEQILNRINDFL